MLKIKIEKAISLFSKKLNMKDCLFFYEQNFEFLCWIFRYFVENKCKKYLVNSLRLVLFGLSFFFFSKNKFYRCKFKKSFYLRNFFIVFGAIKKRSLSLIKDNKKLLFIQRKLFRKNFHFDKDLMEFKKEDKSTVRLKRENENFHFDKDLMELKKEDRFKPESYNFSHRRKYEGAYSKKKNWNKFYKKGNKV